ncbi:MAG: IS4/IS5 family transposase [Proteobacteria bacterium]|nr:MAG: IS4/IS5 family transposase [Pseudomonadota bacterium]
MVAICPSAPSVRVLEREGFIPKTYTIRAVSYLVGTERYVLISTLFDEEISAIDLAKLYRCRWDIEEHFKFLKESARIQRFHSRSLTGVLQEIFATVFLSNLAKSLVLLENGDKTKEENRCEYSQAITYGAFRRVIFNLMNAKRKMIAAITQFIKDCIEAARYKPRLDRKYPRQSFKVIGMWTRQAVGVRY